MDDKQLIDRAATVSANVLYELGYIDAETLKEVLNKHNGAKFQKKTERS